jgi:hypothetical protein
MSKTYSAEIAAVASPRGGGVPFALVAASGLALLAAPTFAIMALFTCLMDRGSAGFFCSAAEGASPLSGMVPMYLLMCAFHCSPWLRLISGRHGCTFRGQLATTEGVCGR